MENLRSSCIRLTSQVVSDFTDRVIPVGTVGFIMETYDSPLCYAIDLKIEDNDYIGGNIWENVILYPEQFEFIQEE